MPSASSTRMTRTGDGAGGKTMTMTWSIAAPALGAAFAASLVEVVEAFTIVLAVATLRGWRRPRPAGAGRDRRRRRLRGGAGGRRAGAPAVGAGAGKQPQIRRRRDAVGVRCLLDRRRARRALAGPGSGAARLRAAVPYC